MNSAPRKLAKLCLLRSYCKRGHNHPSCYSAPFFGFRAFLNKQETEGGRFHCVSHQLKKRGRDFSLCFFMIKTQTLSVFRMPALYERGTPVGKYPFTWKTSFHF